MNPVKVFIADMSPETAEALGGDEEIRVVGAARDGADALREIAELRPDVVVADLVLPNLDGLGLLEALSKESRPKTVILTSLENEEVIKRAVDLGASYFMVKPFNPAVLAARVKEVFTGAGTRAPRLARAKLAEAVSEAELELRITELLHNMGMPPHFRGYAYLRDAVVIAVKNPAAVTNVTKSIYPALARRHGTSEGAVESGIRNAIETSWQRGNTDYLRTFLGVGQSDRCPTFAFLLAKLAEFLRARVTLVAA